MTALLKGQENIAGQDNGHMADNAIVISQLHLSFQVQVVLHHFEEDFYVPPFSVNSHYFLIRQCGVGTEYSQPLPFLMAMADKNDFHFLLIGHLGHNACQYLCSAGSFSQHTVEFTQPYPLAIISVKNLFHILGHADHRQVLAKFGQDRGEAEPAVHQEIVGPYSHGEYPFDHGLQVCCGFCHGLFSSAIPTAALIQILLYALQSLARLDRRAQNKIKGKETVAVRPPQRQQLEAFEFSAAVVIKDPGKQFHHFGPGAIIGGVVKDQYLFPLLTGQQIKKSYNCCRQGHHKLAPIVPGILEELVGSVLAKSQAGVPHNTLGEGDATEGQRENHSEQGSWRDTPQFPDAVFTEQGSNSEVSHKGGNSALQFACFLLFLVLFGIVHVSLSLLILLKISQIPTYQKARGFSR